MDRWLKRFIQRNQRLKTMLIIQAQPNPPGKLQNETIYSNMMKSRTNTVKILQDYLQQVGILAFVDGPCPGCMLLIQHVHFTFVR